MKVCLGVQGLVKNIPGMRPVATPAGDVVKGLPELVLDSVNQTDIDAHKDLFNGVVLAGTRTTAHSMHSARGSPSGGRGECRMRDCAAADCAVIPACMHACKSTPCGHTHTHTHMHDARNYYPISTHVDAHVDVRRLW